MPGCCGCCGRTPVALFAWGLLAGHPLWHAAVDAGPVAVCAVIASRARLSRRSRAVAVCVGLLTSSAVVVHLMNGAIEGHFHFFVMVSVLALYEEWFPYLLAFAFVLGHHGLMGALEPASVYNHPDAIAHPWRWAGIHALFIARAGHRQRRALAAQRGGARRRDAQPRALPPRLRRRAHRHGPHRPRRRGPARQRRALRAPRRRPGRPAAGRPRRRRRPRRPPVPGRRRRDRAALRATPAAWGLWHHSLLTGRDGRPEALDQPLHRRLQAQARRGRALLAGQPRRAHRPAQPRALPRAPQRLAGRRAAASPCCSSTSTTSRSSTTRSATAPATACSAAWPSGCAASCAPATSSPASAATSSPSCCPASPSEAYALAGGAPPGRGPARAAGARRRAPLRHRQRRRELQRARRATIPTRCCATPTRRCTAPRRWASRAARSSTTRCASARWSAWSSRAACATRSTTASCASSTSRWSTLDDGRISGVEALLRWDHPIFGIVAPLRFIPLAERNGLIIPIGAWVLREACRQLAAWGDDALSVSVNVSARQLGSTDLVDVVARGARGLRHRAGPAVPGDHRDGDDGRPRRDRRDALARSRRSACAWPSTTSAWATPRCASCARCCRSTR